MTSFFSNSSSVSPIKELWGLVVGGICRIWHGIPDLNCCLYALEPSGADSSSVREFVSSSPSTSSVRNNEANNANGGHPNDFSPILSSEPSFKGAHAPPEGTATHTLCQESSLRPVASMEPRFGPSNTDTGNALAMSLRSGLSRG